MLIDQIIALKRDRKVISNENIIQFINYSISKNADYSQIGAMLMAIYLNGLSHQETVNFTHAMMHSGRTQNWNGLKRNGPIVDKHSTGGVGDKVSIILVPMLVACGALVPMISGRGLGHTGGTLDKLESFKGYQVNTNQDDLLQSLNEIGGVIVGAGPDIAKADSVLYSVRDITATIDSIPLIVSSILSKKLASSSDYLIIDIKIGNGAFMQNLEQAKQLAKFMCNVSHDLGLNLKVVISDMNQVLGVSVGNALEIIESLDFLKCIYQDKRLLQLILKLGSELLLMSKLSIDLHDAESKLLNVLSSGKAAEIFEKMISNRGGGNNALNKSNLPKANEIQYVRSIKSGYVASVNTKELGLIALRLGAGRKRIGDKIDHSVGISSCLSIGAKVSVGDPIGIIHGLNIHSIYNELKNFINSYEIVEYPVTSQNIIHEVIT